MDDKTVELDEFFDLVITVSDPRIIIDREVSYAVISDDESKPIYHIVSILYFVAL